MATTPDGNGIKNPISHKICKASGSTPSIRTIFLVLFRNPSSSACIPRWKYSSWTSSGKSKKSSLSVMDFANILRIAILSSPSAPGWAARSL